MIVEIKIVKPKKKAKKKKNNKKKENIVLLTTFDDYLTVSLIASLKFALSFNLATYWSRHYNFKYKPIVNTTIKTFNIESSSNFADSSDI